MITLAADCLLFELPSGERIPYSADMVTVELEGNTTELFDAELVRHVMSAVFHYFKHELGRQTLTFGEFAEALEKALRGFAAWGQSSPAAAPTRRLLEADLCRLADESGLGRELVFFPRLRAELQRHMQQAPQMLRFHGLRNCVKQLTGAQRWSPRCQSLETEIVDYLRQCLRAAPAPVELALLVE